MEGGPMESKRVTIVGGGLAGSEAAWQIARRGFPVTLHEMRPTKMTAAHRTGRCAELVCSNSFRGKDLRNAVGLLKEELALLGSLIMEAAMASEVPAGGALAVDRNAFSEFIDSRLAAHPLIRFIREEVTTIPEASRTAPVIVATGPLTSPELAAAIERLLGTKHFAFYDAISPIVLAESLNLDQMFRGSRYEKGAGDDYLNIPLNREQYYAFVRDVAYGEKFSGHEDVEGSMSETLKPFEGCMPIEDMVERGPDTLLFGPLKPVGLVDPLTGKRPYAVVQLRMDDRAGKRWSMVGMQTRLRQGEQLRIFRTLPGMEDAEFVRLGSVHRNSFINSPQCLAPTLELRRVPGFFFAGQLTGVEGYVESTAGGLLAGINAARLLGDEEPITFPIETAIGALMAYISDPSRVDFQPMNIHYGLMPSYLAAETRDQSGKKIPKRLRRLRVAEHARAQVEAIAKTANL